MAAVGKLRALFERNAGVPSSALGPEGFRHQQKQQAHREREEDAKAREKLHHPSSNESLELRFLRISRKLHSSKTASSSAAAGASGDPPGLCGLDGALVWAMTSFLPLMQRVPLSAVCRTMYSRTTDTAAGICRSLTVDPWDHHRWRAIEELVDDTDCDSDWMLDWWHRRGETRKLAKHEAIQGLKKRLMRLQTVDTGAGACPRATLTHVTIGGECGNDVHRDVKRRRRRRGEPLVFPILETLDVVDNSFIQMCRHRRWAFPTLKTLRVGLVCGNESHYRIPQYYPVEDLTAALVHIVSSSPALTSLEGDVIDIPADESQWHALTKALARCPRLTSIKGLTLLDTNYDTLGKLKAALDTHWSSYYRRGVLKTITFHHRFILGAAVSNSLTDLLTWARGVACTIEWLPRTDDRCYDDPLMDDFDPEEDEGTKGWDDMVMDCSADVPSPPPAPRGIGAAAIRETATKCTMVRLSFGGSPLHDSWQDVCDFPRVTHFALEQSDYSVPVGKLAGSVPHWLSQTTADGNNRFLPAVEHFCCSMVCRSAARFASRLPTSDPEVHDLRALVGSLRRVTHVYLRASSLRDMAVCLSFFSSLPHPLDHVELDFEREAGELADGHECEALGLTFPQVDRIHIRHNASTSCPGEYECGPGLSKAHMRYLLSLVTSIRANKVSVAVDMLADDLVFGSLMGDDSWDGSDELFQWEGESKSEGALDREATEEQHVSSRRRSLSWQPDLTTCIAHSESDRPAEGQGQPGGKEDAGGDAGECSQGSLGEGAGEDDASDDGCQVLEAAVRAFGEECLSLVSGTYEGSNEAFLHWPWASGPGDSQVRFPELSLRLVLKEEKRQREGEVG
ncbi:unnamed protein product [Vitrella brassicaformis CCMP3155]|uniref:Uncharacterized protein n=1 Tax=Vitrella brassicaformis (strain CCMP3155) TaxID=1169540 RepID=A0A0G4F586_VITBC|nr:unnamed protein product [Vitrella brassicaformis CCMP3155]|eukprot:CEM06896.1 unnamed protein product [Vitrella brassicaformis CCMP3155]